MTESLVVEASTLHDNLQVKDGVLLSFPPYMPDFAVSPPIEVNIGNASHRVVYGPYKSYHFKKDAKDVSTAHDCELVSEDTPYNDKDGNHFFKQNFQLYLASNSRIINPLHNAPSMSEYYGTERQDYFGQKRTSQKNAAVLSLQLLETLCGGGRQQGMPVQYSALKKLLDKYQASQPDNKVALLVIAVECLQTA